MKRFPLDMNAILSAPTLPREAPAFGRAERVLPDDAEFQFEAETQILLGEFVESIWRTRKSVEKAQGLISRYEGKIPPEKGDDGKECC